MPAVASDPVLRGTVPFGSPGTALAAVAKTSDSDTAPAAAPATEMPFTGSPGRKAARASFQASLPLAWQNRCTVGVQPPETATLSASRRVPSSSVTPSTRIVPRAEAMRRPETTRTLAGAPGISLARESTSVTSAPAAASALATS